MRYNEHDTMQIIAHYNVNKRELLFNNQAAVARQMAHWWFIFIEQCGKTKKMHHAP